MTRSSLPRPTWSRRTAALGSALALMFILFALACTGAPTGVLKTTGDTTLTPSASPSATVAPFNKKPIAIRVFPPKSEINVPAAPDNTEPRVPSSIQLVGTVFHGDGTTSAEVLWSSSKPNVARVDPQGVVTSVLRSATGLVIIKAESRLDPTLTATAEVSVTDFGPSALPPRRPTAALVFPSSITLNTPAEATAPIAVRYPSAARFTGTVFWSDGTLSDDVLWSSSDPFLVAIDASGSVRSLIPHATGSSVVTAQSRSSGLIQSTASVVVVDFPDPKPAPSPVVKTVAVFPTAATINSPPEAGQSAAGRFPSTLQLIGTVILTDGTLDGGVLWSSSNPVLIQVSPTGLATANTPHATGAAVITAISRVNQQASASATVTVQDLGPNVVPITVATVSVFPASASINTPFDASLNQALAGFPTSIQLDGLVLMSNQTTSTDLVWSSSNPNIVFVSQLGLASSVMIRGTGTAVITAQSRVKPSLAATASITVVDNGRVEIDVQ